MTDPGTVNLLPKSIARDIVAKNLGADWADAPYVIKSGNCVKEEVKLPLAYSDIKSITYSPALGRLFILKEQMEFRSVSLFTNYLCHERISFPIGASAVTEVSTALKALGACTSSRSFDC